MTCSDLAAGPRQNPGLPALQPGAIPLGLDPFCRAHFHRGVCACFLESQSGCVPTHAHSWVPDDFGQQWGEGTFQRQPHTEQ